MMTAIPDPVRDRHIDTYIENLNLKEENERLRRALRNIATFSKTANQDMTLSEALDEIEAIAFAAYTRTGGA